MGFIAGWATAAYRANPSLRPELSASTRPSGDTDVVICNLDPNERAYRLKMQAVLPGRSGVTVGSSTLAVGDLITYTLSSELSGLTPFTSGTAGTPGAPVASIDSNDINSAVASRQVGHDEAISVGELYKIGSAIAICTKRTQSAFASKADDGDQTVTANFEVVREGQMSAPPGTNGAGNATGTSQIFGFRAAPLSPSIRAR